MILLIQELDEAEKRYDYLAPLWNEFEHDLVSIKDVDLRTVKVAGVKYPELGEITFEIKPFNTFVKPAWYMDGVAIRAGHHCAQPLLSHLGIGSCCRASFAFYNDSADIDRLIDGLQHVWRMFHA